MGSTTDSAGLCTDCCNHDHSGWVQEFWCGPTYKFSVEYQFTTAAKPVVLRLEHARKYGQPTSFTVTTAGGATHSYVGTWRYTSRYLYWEYDSNAPSYTQGPRVSNDDGLWGAGTGTIDGQQNGNGHWWGDSNEPQYCSSLQWGHGNCDSDDSTCSTLYQNGNTEYCPDLKTFLYCAYDGEHGSGEQGSGSGEQGSGLGEQGSGSGEQGSGLAIGPD